MADHQELSSRKTTTTLLEPENIGEQVPEPLVIPDRIYFRIGEVARLLSVETHVLRYWENQFPQLKPHKSNAKQRMYRRKDIELLNKIKILLYNNGYTIQGAKKLLNEKGKENLLNEVISKKNTMAIQTKIEVNHSDEGPKENIEKCIHDLNELLAIVEES